MAHLCLILVFLLYLPLVSDYYDRSRKNRTTKNNPLHGLKLETLLQELVDFMAGIFSILECAFTAFIPSLRLPAV